MAGWIGQDRDEVYAEFKGHTSPAFADHLRLHFPSHTVARADVCIDFNAPGAFDGLVEVIRRNKGQRTKSGFVSLPDDPDDGQTFAAGVRGGVAYTRAYEIGKHPARRHLCLPDLARLEFEMRPHYAEDKASAASLSPPLLVGMSPWAVRVANAAVGTSIPKFDSQHVTSSTKDPLAYFARSLRRTLEPMIRDGIDLGRTLLDIYAKDDAAAAAWALAVRERRCQPVP
jgi:hypothetical protein